jgi:outer membrane protein assembly factor BamB
MRIWFTAAAAILWPLAASAADQDASALANWAQWRGPLANGTAPSATPPLTWSETEHVRWKTPVPGRGSATPILWQDRLFILTAIPTDRHGLKKDSDRDAPPAGRRMSLEAPTNYYQFCTICYDRNNGQELWRQVATEEIPHEGGHPTNTFASGSPVTDGRHLYVNFGSYGIYCYSLDGQLQWKRDLGEMHTRNGFGEGSSPALHGNSLVVTWDHEGDSAIYALDARNGNTLWQKERDEPTTWATPFIVEHEGTTQVITNGTKRVRSYDLATGALLWECGGQAVNPIPSPVSLDGLVFVMTGYKGYAVYAIPLSARGDLTDSQKVAWKRTDAGPYISSPVLYEGLLYFTKGRDAILNCVDAMTGDEKFFGKRISPLGTLYASPVAAKNRIYFTDRDGTTVVVKAGPRFEVLATNRLPEVIDASAALVGKQLFLRGDQHLYCIEE